MDMIETSILIFGQQSRFVLSDCLSFNFFKERYTPYSRFTGRFILSENLGEIVDVEVRINNTLVHKGYADTVEIKTTSQGKVLIISSKGYSCALGLNELENEIRYGVTLSGLMTGDYALPFVTCEQNTKAANYLYLKEHASLWDAVVNLGQKLENTYPYISYPNNIRLTRHPTTKYLDFSSSDEYISYSDCQDYSKIYSHIHMRDLDGNYNSFNINNTFATQRNIVRHRHINYDRQWSALEDAGLGYKLNFSMRANTSSKLVYKGFHGEDINDCFSIVKQGEAKTYQYISAVTVYGNKKGIFTSLVSYKDAYCNT